jgi:hypothetical protein
MTKFVDLLKKWYLEECIESELLEEKYAEIFELEIDKNSIYNYKETQYKSAELAGEYRAWEFEDRCGNTIVVTYLIGVKEFKSGYKVNGDNSPLIFDPKSLKDTTLIKSCADDRKVNTVYKILVDEVIPKYLLNEKPNRLVFNPVSKSRERLVSILINKAIQQYPELIKKDNYLIYI